MGAGVLEVSIQKLPEDMFTTLRGGVEERPGKGVGGVGGTPEP